MNRDDYFESSSILGGSWGSIENWIEPKIEPPSGKFACPNLFFAPGLNLSIIFAVSEDRYVFEEFFFIHIKFWTKSSQLRPICYGRRQRFF